MKSRKKKLRYAGISAVLVAFIGLGTYFAVGLQQEELVTDDTAILTPVLPQPEVFPHVISRQSTLYTVLRELEVSSQVIQQIVAGAKPVVDLSRLRAGTRFQTFYSETSELNKIKFRFSAIESVEIVKTGDTWQAQKIVEQVDLKVVNFSGVVASSLWESAERAQMDPNLISDLAEIFAWQVDFAREVQVNDRWRLSVEQKIVKGEAIGWGSIIAAEYENSGRLYSAVLFRQNGEELGYFSPDGSNLRRMFLKSPIRYGRISSRFQKKRFHPVLKFHRPHLGVDYAAPTGTPIRTVGNGVVTLAGWSGGGGRTIKIRHNSVYETAYKHLSGFAKGIRSGSKVQQGQLIGYVGSTGLSTGPHLHFEFFKNGSYVDPLGQKFPSADPIPAHLLSQFKTELIDLLATLPSWNSPTVSLQDIPQKESSVSSEPM